MTARRRKSKGINRKAVISIATLALVAVLALTKPLLAQLGYSLQDIIDMVWQPAVTRTVYPSEGTAEVHFIDVGQASAILIKGSEKTALIDGGEVQNATAIIDYLTANGVAKIDYFFNTHPHADHMGGCVGVMDGIATGEFLFTPLPPKIVPTTTGYKKLVDYLNEHKDTITTKKMAYGDTFALGGGLQIEVIGPTNDHKDLNNQSMVLRMDFGATPFLFPGDIEALAEKDLLETGKLTKLAVLAAPHHGSNTSIDEGFLAAIAPNQIEIAAGLPPLVSVISCGAGNDYGHPNPETLARYQEMGIDWYRTDRDGSVKIVTDGDRLTVTSTK